MAEYIEREVLLQHLRKQHDERCQCMVKHIQGAAASAGTLNGIIMYIEKMPAEDVGKRRQGKWTEVRCGEGLFDYYFSCSECKGNTPPRAYPTAPDFCPHCGADMGGTAG